MLQAKSIKDVLIIEDHAIVRAALVSELQKFSDFYNVAGEARDSATGLEKIKELMPDVIILDHLLLKSTGLEVMAELEKLPLKPQVIVFTQIQNPHVLKNYWQLNVVALLDKGAILEDFQTALRAVRVGQRYLSPSFREIIFSSQKLLSKREIEVIAMVARGLSNKEVAEALQCSDQTIKTHKSNIMRKLGVDSSVELGVWASENGIF